MRIVTRKKNGRNGCLLGCSDVKTIMAVAAIGLTCVQHHFWRNSTSRYLHDATIAEKQRQLEFFRQRYQYQAPQNKDSVIDSSLCGEPPEFHDYFAQGKYSRSQFGEDETLSRVLFQKAYNGTFVELGAFDGYHWSNTRFFEACLGWKGLLIEASPRVFPNLIKNRPNAHRLSFAASCMQVNSTIEFDARAKPGSGQFDVDDTAQTKITVPCGPLGPVLKALMPRVSFFSLDVEHAEPLVLKTLDFSEIHVDVFMVEAHYDKPEARASVQETRDILHAAGYQRYSNVVKNSDLYIHPESPYQLNPAEYSIAVE